MATIHLAGAHARATVSTTAGMLLDAEFTVDGTVHRPFARAPWIDESGHDDQPGHLRVLAGEFVAVPFGSVGAPESISPEWAAIVPTAHPVRPHGASADDEWTVIEATGDSVTLALDYPEPSGISRLERTISVRPDAPALDFALTLHARSPVDTAVGLHPILRLPSEPGDLELSVEFTEGFTYPGPVWPGVGPTRPGQTFSTLDAVPAREGRSIDLRRLPLASPTEDVVLLAGATTAVGARFRDSATHLVLDWDRSIIPHVMVWLSDAVLEESPWNRRYRGLGVEPVAAAFDFPNEVSVSANPLVRAGFRTSVHVEPGSPVRIEYSTTCHPFGNMYDVKTGSRHADGEPPGKSQAYI